MTAASREEKIRVTGDVSSSTKRNEDASGIITDILQSHMNTCRRTALTHRGADIILQSKCDEARGCIRNTCTRTNLKQSKEGTRMATQMMARSETRVRESCLPCIDAEE